jgi:pimeloyl-ACP methyl ester carboxylesterase
MRAGADAAADIARIASARVGTTIGGTMETQVAPARDAAPVAAHVVRGGGGVGLHVLEWGEPDGPPLLLVHGWSQSQRCWSRQVSGELAGRFRIVTFDLRGHGMSERPAGAEAYADPGLWAADLAAVIEALSLERPTLVAWSYGGFVVTDYLGVHGDGALRGINLVGGAVTLAPPGFPDIGPGFLENAPDACRDDLAVNIAALTRFMDALTVRPLTGEDLAATLCWTMVVPPEVRGALIARAIDGTDALARVSVPVLVSHGRRDRIVLPSMAERVLDACPAATASWYEDAGHMPFVEDQARFDRELTRFADAAGA